MNDPPKDIEKYADLLGDLENQNHEIPKEKKEEVEEKGAFLPFKSLEQDKEELLKKTGISKFCPECKDKRSYCYTSEGQGWLCDCGLLEKVIPVEPKENLHTKPKSALNEYKKKQLDEIRKQNTKFIISSIRMYLDTLEEELLND